MLLDILDISRMSEAWRCVHNDNKQASSQRINTHTRIRNINACEWFQTAQFIGMLWTHTHTRWAMRHAWPSPVHLHRRHHHHNQQYDHMAGVCQLRTNLRSCLARTRPMLSSRSSAQCCHEYTIDISQCRQIPTPPTPSTFNKHAANRYLIYIYIVNIEIIVTGMFCNRGACPIDGCLWPIWAMLPFCGNSIPSSAQQSVCEVVKILQILDHTNYPLYHFVHPTANASHQCIHSNIAVELMKWMPLEKTGVYLFSHQTPSNWSCKWFIFLISIRDRIKKQWLTFAANHLGWQWHHLCIRIAHQSPKSIWAESMSSSWHAILYKQNVHSLS